MSCLRNIYGNQPISLDQFLGTVASTPLQHQTLQTVPPTTPPLQNQTMQNQQQQQQQQNMNSQNLIITSQNNHIVVSFLQILNL